MSTAKGTGTIGFGKWVSGREDELVSQRGILSVLGHQPAVRTLHNVGN